MQILEAVTDAIERINNLLPHFGKPRTLATTDKATTWREVTIGNQTFRVLTLEDGK